MFPIFHQLTRLDMKESEVNIFMSIFPFFVD